MSNIDISVVIPTHNRRDLLREMLEALACQTFPAPRFEVIVVADGVTDGTQEMLRRQETPYSLGVLDQWQSGVAVARNRGARCARGSLLVFLDDDVLPVPRLLEEHALTQRENPPGVVLGRLLPAGTGRKKGWQVWEERVFQKYYQAVLEGRRPPAGRRLYSGNFSVPRLAFLQVGGFNEGMERGEDIELGFRLEQAGVPFYFNPAAAAVHRAIAASPPGAAPPTSMAGRMSSWPEGVSTPSPFPKSGPGTTGSHLPSTGSWASLWGGLASKVPWPGLWRPGGSVHPPGDACPGPSCLQPYLQPPVLAGCGR